MNNLNSIGLFLIGLSFVFFGGAFQYIGADLLFTIISVIVGIIIILVPVFSSKPKEVE